MAPRALPVVGRVSAHARPRYETPLDTWLTTHGVGRFTFARLLGCDPKMVGYWADGQVLPSLVYAFKIEAETGGEVRVDSWLGTYLGKLHWGSVGADWEDMEVERRAARQRNRKKVRAAAKAAKAAKESPEVSP